MHAVWPCASWYFPASQMAHVACCGWSLYVPGATDWNSSAPHVWVSLQTRSVVAVWFTLMYCAGTGEHAEIGSHRRGCV